MARKYDCVKAGKFKKSGQHPSAFTFDGEPGMTNRVRFKLI